MTGSSEWTGRVGSVWAAEWRRTDRSFGALTTRVLDAAEIGTFDTALDIGCGAGELTRALAVSNPGARVLGIDISPELVAVARSRCGDLANAALAEADAARWMPDDGVRPDLLISRHGVMFFADPVAAFAHLRTAAAPGARLRFSCFRTFAENGWARELTDAAGAAQAAPDPSAPGPFAFGDDARVTAILEAAGWHGIAFEPVDYAMIAGEGENAVEEAVAYFQRIGPAARAIAELPPDERSAAIERLRARLARHCTDGRLTLPAAAWIVTARTPHGPRL